MEVVSKARRRAFERKVWSLGPRIIHSGARAGRWRYTMDPGRVYASEWTRNVAWEFCAVVVRDERDVKF
jgi:hypothetical protein